MQTWNQNSNFVSDDRSQNIVRLLEQSAATSSSVHLRRNEILPFLRKIETKVVEQDTIAKQCVVVYWSSDDASWLMPARTQMNALVQSSLACTNFSEHKKGSQDEFCFIVMSKELCILVYGQCSEAGFTDAKYQCCISFDSQAVKRIYQTQSLYWEFADPHEADKLAEAVGRLPALQTLAHLSNSLGNDWSSLAAPPKPAVIPSAEPNPKTRRIIKHDGQQIIQSQSPTPTSAAPIDWTQRIATDYPYPIANPYRTLECITEASEKYKEQLRLVENLLALLAGLSLAITAPNDPSIVSVLKSSIMTGVSVGHWRELIRKCSAIWRESSTKDIPLAKAILDLRVELVERGFGKAIEQLVRARNDFAHHRGPTAESQIEKETVRLAELLSVAIEQTAFLCDYPMKIVRSIDVLPSGSIKMICLKATGDHPALRQEELRMNRGFPKGQLILNAGNNNWLSLYPFLTQDICPKCGSMEIYLLDKWKFDKNIIYLRSFERGHTQESTAISDALKSMCK